jgi:hypothetical protein
MGLNPTILRQAQDLASFSALQITQPSPATPTASGLVLGREARVQDHLGKDRNPRDSRPHSNPARNRVHRPKRTYASRDSSACASAISGISGVGENLLRHTVYIGLREDKPASDVRREVARVP